MESLLSSLAAMLYFNALVLVLVGLSKHIGGAEYAQRYKCLFDSATILLLVAVLVLAIRIAIF